MTNEKKILRKNYLLLFFICIDFFYITRDNDFTSILIHPADYSRSGMNSSYYELAGQKFYYYFPIDTDANALNGYYGFPGTESLFTLERIEMRGGKLNNGFRPREEYRNIAYDFQGRFLTSEQIKILHLDGLYDGEIIQK